jgi:hypothetical protein
MGMRIIKFNPVVNFFLNEKKKKKKKQTQNYLMTKRQKEKNR